MLALDVPTTHTVSLGDISTWISREEVMEMSSDEERQTQTERQRESDRETERKRQR